MATWIVFPNGQETAVTETEDQVVQPVGLGHPHPVKPGGTDGMLLRDVNWAHVTSIGPQPSPVP